MEPESELTRRAQVDAKRAILFASVLFLVIIGSFAFLISDMNRSLERVVAPPVVSGRVVNSSNNQPVAKIINESVSPHKVLSQDAIRKFALSKKEQERALAPSSNIRGRQRLNAECKLLLAEGDQFFSRGDLVNARASYEHAIEFKELAAGKQAAELIPMMGKLTICVSRLGDDYVTGICIKRLSELKQVHPNVFERDPVVVQQLVDIGNECKNATLRSNLRLMTQARKHRD
jgi:hypothetical protein